MREARNGRRYYVVGDRPDAHSLVTIVEVEGWFRGQGYGVKASVVESMRVVSAPVEEDE